MIAARIRRTTQVSASCKRVARLLFVPCRRTRFPSRWHGVFPHFKHAHTPPHLHARTRHQKATRRLANATRTFTSTCQMRKI